MLSASPTSHGILVVANQKEHTALLIDPDTHKEIAKIPVGINGHEVTVDKAGKFAYVPIYGDSGVGRPGSDGSTIDVIDIAARKLAYTIDLGKPLRPHDPHFGPDGLLYVTAELSQSIDAIDPNTRKIVAEVPTGQDESHMFVIRPGPDRVTAYTANVHAGTVSVLDLGKRSLIKTIPVSKMVQRISIQPDGLYVFTHDQESPRIVVIDPLSNAGKPQSVIGKHSGRLPKVAGTCGNGSELSGTSDEGDPRSDDRGHDRIPVNLPAQFVH